MKPVMKQENDFKDQGEKMLGTKIIGKKRSICDRCQRPLPRACICSALPETLLRPFEKCRVVVLQHPQEAKRKNRSLPLVQLCLSQNYDVYFQVVIARRLGDKVDPTVMKQINDPDQDVILFYPNSQSITLEQGLMEVERRRKQRNNHRTTNKESTTTTTTNEERGNMMEPNEKVILIFLDATWKYAKEMERACTLHNTWPQNIIRVQFSPMDKDQTTTTTSTTTDHDLNIKHPLPNNNQNDSIIITEKEQKLKKTLKSDTTRPPEGFKVRRFDIRTPPSSNHLSTAECITWAVSVIEEKPQIYETMMKPLDLMVEKWHSFSKQNDDMKQKQPDDENNIHKRIKKE